MVCLLNCWVCILLINQWVVLDIVQLGVSCKYMILGNVFISSEDWFVVNVILVLISFGVVLVFIGLMWCVMLMGKNIIDGLFMSNFCCFLCRMWILLDFSKCS